MYVGESVNRPYQKGKTIVANFKAGGGNLSRDKGKTPTPRLPWPCNGVLPLHSARLWLGYIPTPHPFRAGASTADRGQLSSINWSLDVANMGNNLFFPLRGIPGPSSGAPSHRIAPGRMCICRKPLPSHPHLVPAHPCGSTHYISIILYI